MLTAVSGSLLLGLLVPLLASHGGHRYMIAGVGVLALGALTLAGLPALGDRAKRLARVLSWWHTLWLLAFLSGLVFRVRSADTVQDDPVDFWALYRMGLVAVVGGVLLARLAMRRPQWLPSLVAGLPACLALYAAVSVASSLWSVFPMWTLYRSVEYAVGVVLISAILACVRSIEDYKTLFDWTWILLGLMAATVWLGAVLWPEEAIRRGVGLIDFQLSGVLPAVAANGVGDLGAILGVVSLVRFLHGRRGRTLYLATLVASILTLVLSQSRSPLAGFLVALGVTLFAAGRIGAATLGPVLALPVLLMTPAGAVFWGSFMRGQTHDMFFSLSGRMSLWEVSGQLVSQKPLLGHGAYAASRFLVARDRPYGDAVISGADNAFIEVLSGVGVVGLVPLVLAIGGTWYWLWRSRGSMDAAHSQLVIEAIGVMTVLSVRAVFTAGTFIGHPALAFLLVLGFAELSRRPRGPGP